MGHRLVARVGAPPATALTTFRFTAHVILAAALAGACARTVATPPASAPAAPPAPLASAATPPAPIVSSPPPAASSAPAPKPAPPDKSADNAGQLAGAEGSGRLGAVADPSYLRIAEATGGSAVDGRIAVAPETPFLNSAGLAARPVIAVLARRKQTATESELVPFVVDRSIERVDFRVRAPSGSKPVVSDPNGQALAPLRERNGYLEYGMLAPPSGEWRFSLSGAAGKPYELEAQGSGRLVQRISVSESASRWS